jgi:serine phosphatase RsbU (regulator of sigma subunit)/anti-sigma regulatory factor (Ser/Thr protein kinase)
VPFSDAEKHGLETFATILGQTLERTVLAEHEQRVAMTLQHAMLGRPDEVTSVVVSTSYRPADERLEIGGDWFDVIELRNGRVGLVVGDVVGHNVGAAAAMGQLRSALRALAGVLEDPAIVLAALQRLVADEDASRCTTLLYGVLDPAAHVLEYCSAGHPPALVVDEQGEATYLMGARGTPIGSYVSSPPTTAVAHLTPGSALVFYTDGLVERRGEVLDVGLERLADAATRLAREASSGEDLAERIVDAMLETGPQDDVAVLVARLDPARLIRRLPAAAPELSQLRNDVRGWFAARGVARDEGEEMLVAISEAVNNAVEHAYLDRAPGIVTVELEYREPHTVVAIVRDEGTWREGPSPDTRGRGLSLMRALCTDLDVVHGDDGAEIRLERRFRVLEPV